MTEVEMRELIQQRDDADAALDLTMRALTTLQKATRKLLASLAGRGHGYAVHEAMEECHAALGTEGSVSPTPVNITSKVRR